jgi:uncharacterized small protein (DUF1192 family)
VSGISLSTAQQHLQAWLNAELAVTAAQSYTIGTRSLSKANLGEIREQIKFWQNEVARLENLEKSKGRNRAYRFVPRDL